MSDTQWQDMLNLVELLEAGEYEHAEVSVGDVQVRLSKTAPLSSPSGAPQVPAAPEPASAVGPSAPPVPDAAATSPALASPPEPEGTEVTAPLLGVFYRSPSPGADPFVQPGDPVTADTTIGIIEVMKMMNPLPAGVDGVLAGFAVEDTAGVEYGQVIARITEGADS